MFSVFVVSLDKYIESYNRFVWDQVVNTLINYKSEGWEPHVGALAVTNEDTVGDLPMLTEGV